ncbi:isovalerate--CoA ligase AAE2-like [Nicotiana tabacum]|uniref:Isovalerate--CoA ligase AAE2-like n=1 Tax=Nicotiana tabacum TaxID=4097 RepID=A0AC58T454_TOBAC
MNPFFNIPKFSGWFYALNRVRVHPTLSQSPRYMCQISENNLETHPWQSKEGLTRCSANYFPLTPISFLDRAAKVFRDRTSVVYGSSVKYTWEQTHNGCLKLASALSQLGISRGDVVMYETLLATGNNDFAIRWPLSEFDPISVNYTSGTTPRPIGIVFNHRGAYLSAIASSFIHEMDSMPTYLYTLPMFHCNGWCLVWVLAALGGTNICLRHVSTKDIFDNISLHKVTHMSAAPTVLNMIANSPPSDRKSLSHKVDIMTGGSPPPPDILSKMEELGFSVSHLYGLTENGPCTSCLWKPEWETLPPDKRYVRKARQGVPHFSMQEVDVKDTPTMERVPKDGKTMGEIMFRGNTVMSGYLKDLKAIEEAFRRGWFHSGDLAVRHPDGYIEVKDRIKDVIISGGVNISSVEVERVLCSHPAVLEAAVVARPDDHWGQTPCAFVKLKEGFNVDAQEIISFCRDHLPHYMAPRTVIL